MDLFHQGLVAGVSILAGMCAFNYWMFVLLQNKLESKLDNMSNDIHSIAQELVEERRNKANLYNFVLENVKK